MSDKYQGLNDEQIKQSKEKNGENIITPAKRISLWKLYFEKFEDPIIKILLFAIVLSLIIAFVENEFTEVIGVTVAVILATSIGFWFEYDANRKFEILNSLSDESLVRVIRNGNVHEILKKDIVVGDIVLLENGEEIPADGELLEGMSLQVNESTLTGEPIIHKTTDIAEFEKEATYPSNHLLRGTTVVEGHGIMRVFAVGDATELGRVAKLSTEKSEEKTPLTLQLDHLAEIISVVGGGFAFTVFIALYLKNIFLSNIEYTFGQQFMLTAMLVTIVVALSKIWLSLIYKAKALIKHKDVKVNGVIKLRWWFWVILAIIVYVVLSLYCREVYGVNGLNLSSWLTIDMFESILSYFMIAVTLIVVAVPEGLPMSVTLSLALNMRRMLKTNNLVRKMHASETMGAINVICTDKTGTLTQNQMRVHEVQFSIADEINKKDDRGTKIIEESLSINTTAHLESDEKGNTKTIGNPTEAALLLWLKEIGLDYTATRSKLEVIDQITFSTKNKYMATMVDSKTLGSKVIYLKGAPEVILSLCSKLDKKGDIINLESYKKDIEKQLLDYQNGAKRTLGFAYKKVDGGKCSDHIDGNDFVFMGIAAISDPVRTDVPDAVNEVREAGIDVKIVTGDTPATAIEIARQIGIWDDKKDGSTNQITGLEFEALTDEELLKRANKLKVISRARPHDKQRLVQALQRIGKVVAVTGDGTNDAPALNHAHVGLSMGSGTSVAKEASDITLIDDSFRSISTAVMWGRSLYKNIQRFLYFQLTINCLALVVVLIGTFLGREVPLTITQMLWVNLIMDTFAAAALASLPPSRSVMREKPRAKGAFIITSLMWKSIMGMAMLQLCILIVFLVFMPQFFSEEYGLTIFFTMFVMMQFWNLFNAKALMSGGQSAFKGLRWNDPFLLVAVIILIGQILIVTFGGEMFRTVPLSPLHWIGIIVLTSLILWGGELYRYCIRRKVSK